MELRTHDLIRIDGIEDLFSKEPFPDWVAPALERAKMVVVRREQLKDGMVPVGIRGTGRSQRFAAWLKMKAHFSVITPAALISAANWQKNYEENMPPVLQSLLLISPWMELTGYEWGPTGSAAFELASGISTVRHNSDLDIVMQVPQRISINEAAALLTKLEEVAQCRLDVQMSTPAGAVAIREYIQSPQVLVKTVNGPVILPAAWLWN